MRNSRKLMDAMFKSAFIFLLMNEAVLPFKKVCYFPNWSAKAGHPDVRFTIKDIPTDLCTHVIYSFASINRDSLELIPTDANDINGNNNGGHYEEFNNLKTETPSLLTMISVGGTTEANKVLAFLVLSEQTRRIFVRNALAFLRKWKFDGLDVDWEFPGNPPETKEGLSRLLEGLQAAFQKEAEETGKSKLILSAACPVGKHLVDKGFQVERISNAVDFINLMGYNFHGPWNKIAGLISPLYHRANDKRFSPSLSLESALDMWIRRGAAVEKIVVGIAGFGASFTLQNSTQTEVGAPVVGPGKAGPFRMTAGQLSYVEICLMLQKGGTLKWDKVQKSPYAFLDHTWVGFDNQQSIAIKINWMVSRGVAGAMFWSLDMDDFKGVICNQGRFPLVRTISETAAKYFPVKTRGMPARAEVKNNEAKNNSKQPNLTATTQKVTMETSPFPFNLPMNSAISISSFVTFTVPRALSFLAGFNVVFSACLSLCLRYATKLVIHSVI